MRSKLTSLLLLFVALAFGIVACDSGGGMDSEPDSDPEPGDVEATVQGSVTDSESGDPISGADVSVLRVDADSQLAQATTGDEGSYELSFTVPEDDTPDQLAIKTEAEGFMAKTDTASFNQSLTQDVALEVVATEVTASGAVTDEESGEGIEGAAVTGSDPDGNVLFEDTTGAGGEYQKDFEVAEEPEEVTITAEAEDFESGQQTVGFSEEITADFQLSLATTEATASGTVTDNDTGDPIEGATVTGTSGSGSMLFETKTDANGDYQEAFEVADEPEEVTITASADGFADTQETTTFSQEISLSLSLQPRTETTVSGTITDGNTDSPVEGATVRGENPTADEEFFETTTGSDGQYQTTFEVVGSPSEINVSAEANNYNSGETTVSFSEEVNADLSLDPETVDILVEGTVASEESEPLNGATIEAFPAGQDEVRLDQSTSASDGSYELAFTLDVPRTPDEFRLEAAADSFETEETSVAFASTINQDFDLRQNRFSLNLSVDGEGSISTSLLSGDLNENGYLLGSEVEVEVIPDGNNVFFGWEGNIEGSSNPVTVEVTESLEATAEVGTPQEGLSLGIGLVQIGSTIDEASFSLSNNLPENVVVTGFTLFDENGNEVVNTSNESLTIEPDDSGGFSVSFGLGPTPEELEQFETVWEFEFRGGTFEKEVVVGDVFDASPPDDPFSRLDTGSNMIDLEEE